MIQKASPIKWAIFTSGWGRSAQNCMQLFNSGELGKNTINCIVTIGQDTPLVNMAIKQHIKLLNDNPKTHIDFDEYQSWLANELIKENIDYIFLLNFKYRIRKNLLDAFPNRIINIHPSLLPSFKNTKSAIQDAMKYGVKVSGITTHIIDEQIDEGIILHQKPIAFSYSDNFETLDAKYVKKGSEIVKETFDLIELKHCPINYLKEYLKR